MDGSTLPAPYARREAEAPSPDEAVLELARLLARSLARQHHAEDQRRRAEAGK
jgi:hypothetical protein